MIDDRVLVSSKFPSHKTCILLVTTYGLHANRFSVTLHSIKVLRNGNNDHIS